MCNSWLFRAVRSCILFRRSCCVWLILLISVRVRSSVVSIWPRSASSRRRSLWSWRDSMVRIPCIGSRTSMRISGCPWIITVNVLVSISGLGWRNDLTDLARCLFNFIYVLFECISDLGRMLFPFSFPANFIQIVRWRRHRILVATRLERSLAVVLRSVMVLICVAGGRWLVVQIAFSTMLGQTLFWISFRRVWNLSLFALIKCRIMSRCISDLLSMGIFTWNSVMGLRYSRVVAVRIACWRGCLWWAPLDFVCSQLFQIGDARF